LEDATSNKVKDSIGLGCGGWRDGLYTHQGQEAPQGMVHKRWLVVGNKNRIEVVKRWAEYFSQLKSPFNGYHTNHCRMIMA
jgi:hypothetical protein